MNLLPIRIVSIDRLTNAGFAIVLFLLVTLALLHDYAFDEAWSYLEGMSASLWGIISYQEFYLANNHLLNTLQMRVVAIFDFNHPFPFRIVSLACFVGAFLVLRHTIARHGSGMSLAALSVLAMPWTIYFAQARGYSLAIFFMICLVALYFKLREKFTLKSFLAYSFSAVGCILSIFSFVFPVAALTLLLIPSAARFIGNESLLRVTYAAIIALPALITIWYIYYAGQIISERDLLIVGTDQVFRGGMLSSLLSYMASQGAFDDGIGFHIARTAILLSIVAFMVFCVRTKQLPVELLVALVTIVLLVLSHYALGSLYPKSRAVMFVPLVLYLGAARVIPLSRWMTWILVFVPPVVSGALSFSLVFEKIDRPTSVELVEFIELETDCSTIYRDKGHRNLVLAQMRVGSDKFEIIEHEPWAETPKMPFETAAREHDCLMVYKTELTSSSIMVTHEPVFQDQYGTLLVRIPSN